ncbi:MAG: hypothetical protein A2147_01830 [Chloroflexi bacterium RBG_16_57_8]|nr:MAG: hypothetical protein A2147_01830 [Chloroflexi bacterium RBG_16_57_8]
MKTEESQNRLKEIERALKELKPSLESRFKVSELGIFGSYRRAEQKKRSDLDLLVEFSETVSLFDFVDLQDFLSDTLGVKVDLVMKDALKPGIKERVLTEAVYV